MKYWQDATGARRLVPVKIGDINLEVIVENREQWLAEARVLFENGATWWEFPSEIEAAQEDRQQIDPWEDTLKYRIANGRTVKSSSGSEETLSWPVGFISSAEIMKDWLELAPHQQGPASGRRLAQVMYRLEFRPHREGKSRQRGWVRATADTSGETE